MDDLIIQVLSETASPFEEERLRRWRESAPENEAYYQEMSQVWVLTLPEPVDSGSTPPKPEAILAAASSRISAEDEPGSVPHLKAQGAPRSTGRVSPWSKWGLLAATLAAVGLGVHLLRPGAPEPLTTYRAPQSASLMVTLADGSFARLARESVLQEWDVEGRREVTLEGRAFFAVARDETRPFIVRTGPGSVRVLGTRFQVDTEGGTVETVVVEGTVEISNEHGVVELPAGTVGRMSEGRTPERHEVTDPFAFLDWSEGVLMFQGTRLDQVADEVSRHFGRVLQIDSSGLAQRRVTARFQGEPFENVVESLCLVTEADCTAIQGGYVMRGGEGEG